MGAKDFGGLEQLLQKGDEVAELVLDQNQPRSLQPGGAVRHAERQPGDSLCLDREAAGLQPELPMVGIEPERFLGAVGVSDTQQTLAAEIEIEPRSFERP